MAAWFFRKLPKWLDGLFNGEALLRAVAQRSHLTSASEQGEMTHLMLDMEQSHLDKELDKLEDWLEKDGRPDLIVLSNGLLAGFSRELKARLSVPVVCTFQGEDAFLDGLPEPWGTKCWLEMARSLELCDALVSPSQYYASYMAERTGLPEEDIEVIPNGVDLSLYQGLRNESTEPVIGYLARMNSEKGLGLLIEAFIQLEHPTACLAIAGTMSTEDFEYIAQQKDRLAEAGLTDRVEWQHNLELEEKVSFLESLTVFSVPATYSEAFGLYLIEAMACGVPVVMPRASAFTEIIEAAECGELVEPNDASALAAAWDQLLEDQSKREVLGKKGRRAVEERYHVEAMAQNFEELFRKVVQK